MAYNVVAIPTGIADAVRTEMLSPKYKHPAHRSLATGYGPCRHCLNYFSKGRDERILFTYDPFDGLSDYALPGPVFIHADACERYAETAGFPDALLAHPLTLQAYGEERRLWEEIRITAGPVDDIIEQLLAEPHTRYLHVRDTQAGCYDFRIEKMP